MAKYRPRFLPKALIGMSAVAALAVMMPTPARAETVDLMCSFDGSDMHVSVDTDRQSVVETTDKRYGPFVASISDTLIRWTVHNATDQELQYTIDRVAGTITLVRIYQGDLKGNYRGKCQRATKKF